MKLGLESLDAAEPTLVDNQGQVVKKCYPYWSTDENIDAARDMVIVTDE